MKKHSRFSSRKFLLVQLTIVQAILVPIVFKMLQIDDSVSMAVIGIVAASSAAYSAANIAEAKIGGSGE